MLSQQQVKRQFQEGRLALHPASHVQPQPPPVPPPRKMAAPSRSKVDKDQQSEPPVLIKTKSSGAATSLKAVMRMSTLLPHGSKASGQPPAIHPPWNKARIGPMEAGEGREWLQERKVGRECERGEAEGRANKEAAEESTEKRSRGEKETWERGSKGGATENRVMNGVGGGEGIRPEHRGELPGLPSGRRFFSVDDNIVINGSYFQTSAETSKPPTVKQKSSEALSLISLTRRLQGATRVGNVQWSERISPEKGKNSRKIYGSIGEMSVSASVSERGTGSERRRWQVGDEGPSSEGRWRRGRKTHSCDSGSGSKESQSEVSLSDASSITSSVTAGHTSGTETEGDESDSATSDTDGESDSGSPDDGGEGSESEESGLESEDERTESRRRSGSNNLKKDIRRRERSSHFSSSSRYSGSTLSRPKTSSHTRSSHETIEEESEEEAADTGALKPSSSKRASDQSNTSSGVTDTSDDLSPIIEEDEERNGGCSREGDEENESAA